VNENKVRALGLRRTGQRDHTQLGQWFVAPDGEPRQEARRQPRSADLFELLEADPASTVGSATIRCPTCGKTDEFRIPDWPKRGRPLEAECFECSRRRSRAP
jgi:hypothetical protein